MGCIPVIIADNIELPFEQFLDYRSFTVKIAEEDVARLKEILMVRTHYLITTSSPFLYL